MTIIQIIFCLMVNFLKKEMLVLKKKIFGLMVLGLLTSLPSWAVTSDLDLEGNGTFTTVNLPFNYLERQEGCTPTLIHQGGYKVYDLQQSQQDIAVIGPLRPCIGIAVTDGVKLVTFHKHATNSLDSMKEILEANLNLGDKSAWHARIFTAKDDLEWQLNKRSLMHAEKGHAGAVKDIKDFLEAMGMKRAQIPASLHPLRPDASSPLHYADLQLGRYELAEICVAVKLNDLFETSGGTRQIKFFSTDPFQEDIFNYKGTYITEEEMLSAPTSDQRQQTDPSELTVPFDDIPFFAFQQEGRADGYRYQRGICQRRMDQEEKELYERHFGQGSQQTIDEQVGIGNHGYGTLRFYPL